MARRTVRLELMNRTAKTGSVKRKQPKHIQPDRINMAVLFWFLVKSDDSVRYCAVYVHLTSHVLQVPETHGHV